MQFSARTRISSKNKHVVKRAIIVYLLDTPNIRVIFLYNWTQCIDALVIYYKDMLENVTMQRTQQFHRAECLLFSGHLLAVLKSVIFNNYSPKAK